MGANCREIPQTLVRFLCLNTFAPRRFAAAGPVRRPIRTFWGLGPASNCFYIDAVTSRTVTCKTLLRYTFNCHGVNVLIRGFLWKKGAGFFAGSSGASSHSQTANPDRYCFTVQA
jgi:hypothetical protein